VVGLWYKANRSQIAVVKFRPRPEFGWTLSVCRAILYERKPNGNAMPVIEPNRVALPTISREDQQR
jgi:hypothetical protein